MKSEIITHRGLDLSLRDWYSESTYEAFENHLSNGYSIEFDPAFTKDGIVVWHDKTLKRLSKARDNRLLGECNVEEVLSFPIEKGRLCTLDELLFLISKNKASFNALHLKGGYQSKGNLDRLIGILENHPQAMKKLFVFDLKEESAKHFKEKYPDLSLGISIAHPFDIERYNEAVLKTLNSIEKAVSLKPFYDWAWLDEWDLLDENGGRKKLYTEETFNVLRKVGFKIALVTPEIHATSPGLLGGESHPDAKNRDHLFERIREILRFKPDAICTDYPKEVEELSLEETNCF